MKDGSLKINTPASLIVSHTETFFKMAPTTCQKCLTWLQVLVKSSKKCVVQIIRLCSNFNMPVINIVSKELKIIFWTVSNGKGNIIKSFRQKSV